MGVFSSKHGGCATATVETVLHLLSAQALCAGCDRFALLALAMADRKVPREIIDLQVVIQFPMAQTYAY